MNGLKIKDIFGRNLLSIIVSPEAGKKPVYKGAELDRFKRMAGLRNANSGVRPQIKVNTKSGARSRSMTQ